MILRRRRSDVTDWLETDERGSFNSGVIGYWPLETGIGTFLSNYFCTTHTRGLSLMPEVGVTHLRQPV
jgi:hypothetical protein